MLRILNLIIIVSILFVFGCTKNDHESESVVISWDGNAFLRGSFNNWATDIPFKRDASKYYAEATFKKGLNEFKIGDQEWKYINYGTDRLEPITIGEEYPMSLNGNNFAYNLEDEQAPFVITVSGVGSEKLVLTIVRGRISSYE